MGIRFPLKAVLSYSNQTVQGGGPTSLVGGVAKTFTLPQDCDNVVVKLSASVKGGGVSATFQTSDDGGTTYYDVARTSVVSNAVAATTAQWLSIPVISGGVNPIVNSTANVGSILGGAVGTAAASALGSQTVSGLPILGPYNRIFLIYTAAITSIINEAVTVYANSQSKNS